MNRFWGMAILILGVTLLLTTGATTAIGFQNVFRQAAIGALAHFSWLSFGLSYVKQWCVVGVVLCLGCGYAYPRAR